MKAVYWSYLWDAIKAMFTGKFIALSVYIRTGDLKSTLIFYIGKEAGWLTKKQIKPKVNQREKNNKAKSRNNKQESKHARKTNKVNIWCFEIINKIHNPLARLSKKIGEIKISRTRGDSCTTLWMYEMLVNCLF